MAQYHVKTPDGAEYDVTAPDGASQADVLKYAQAQHATQPPAVKQVTYTATGPDGKDYSINGPPGATQAEVAAQLHTHFTAARTQRYMDAIRTADAAGNEDEARRLAGLMKAERGGGQSNSVAPQAPVDQNSGGLYAAVHDFEDSATLGLGDHIAAGLAANVIGPLTGNPSLTSDAAYRDIKARAAASDAAHPFYGDAGMVSGVVPLAIAGGELAGGARMLPGASRAAAALEAAPRLVRGAVKTAGVLGSGAAVGGAQGYNETGTLAGTESGAAFGGLTAPLGLLAGKTLVGPASASLMLIAKHAKLPGETMAAAARRISQSADDFIQKFGHMPTLSEMLDHTQAREIASTIGRSPQATALAGSQEEALAIGRQGDLAGALANGQSTPAAEDVRAGATARLSKTMTQIGANHVPLDKAQGDIDVLTSPDVAAVLRGPSYAPARNAIAEIRDNGATSIPLRDLETIRSATARAAKSADTVQAANYGGIRDHVRAIAEQHDGYKAAMGDYQNHMRYAENLDIGAAGLNPSTTPVDFRAGFNNQPVDANGQTSDVGRAAQAGQRAGLRTAAVSTATQSPNAAASFSRSLAQDTGLNDKLTTALGPAEAARMRDVGTTAFNAARGAAAIVPPAKTAASAAADATSHAVRMAVLGAHGGGSFMIADTVNWLMKNVGLGKGTALKIAELSTDPAQTSGVMNYLKAHGGSAQLRREFLGHLRARAEGLTAAAMGGGIAGGGYADQPSQ